MPIFCLMFLFFSLPFLSITSWNFLRFHFDLSIMFLSIYLCLAFLMVVLDITVCIHHSPVWSGFYHPSELSKYTVLLKLLKIYSPIYIIIILNSSSNMHLEPSQDSCNICFNHQSWFGKLKRRKYISFALSVVLFPLSGSLKLFYHFLFFFFF